MPGGTGGLGTSGQTANTNQATAGQSITGPWAPATAPIQNLLLPGIINNNQAYAPGAAETGAYNNAISALGNTPNYAPSQLNQISGQLYGTSGDPFGAFGAAQGNLNRAAGSIPGYQNFLNQGANYGNQGAIDTQNTFSRLNNFAAANPDPMQTPGIQNLLSTIRNDVSNQVNSQFAGAGRSLSGLNQQDLARGISQGEAAPLLNQYNANVGNILQAQGLQGQLGGQLGSIGASQAGIAGLGGQLAGLQGNLGQQYASLGNQQLQNYAMAPQLAQQSPYLASMPYAQQQQLLQQQRLAPLEGLGAQENLYVPLAGLGGQAQNMQNSIGSVQGTGTASPLSQISSGIGILGGLFGGGFL